MTPRVCRNVLLLASLSALSMGATELHRPASVPTAGKDAGGVQVSHIEVRLRKLHLVRPDLIPYPIAYEVVC
jgi:hypothetical protein